MGTCIGITEDRQTVQVDYPSEPILAEAAALFMLNTTIYQSCIQYLQQAVSFNIFNGIHLLFLYFYLIFFLFNFTDVSDMGELVSRIILIRCFDSLITTQSTHLQVFLGAKVTVKSFLNHLFNSSNITCLVPIGMCLVLSLVILS